MDLPSAWAREDLGVLSWLSLRVGIADRSSTDNGSPVPTGPWPTKDHNEW
jgi:hypothetical protein